MLENLVFLGSADSRDSVEENHTLTNHAKLGLLGKRRSNYQTGTECRFCCFRHELLG